MIESILQQRKLRVVPSQEVAHSGLDVLLFFSISLLIVFVSTALGLGWCTGLSPVVARGGYSLAVVLGLFTAVASLVAEHGL